MVMSGEKKIISTKKNTRKNTYFNARKPALARIALKGGSSARVYKIIKISETPDAWHVHVEQFEEQKDCKHPPARLFSWNAGKLLCVGCCVCGSVLAGGMGYQGPF
jgi:hypothetical protein